MIRVDSCWVRETVLLPEDLVKVVPGQSFDRRSLYVESILILARQLMCLSLSTIPELELVLILYELSLFLDRDFPSRFRLVIRFKTSQVEVEVSLHSRSTVGITLPLPLGLVPFQGAFSDLSRRL